MTTRLSRLLDDVAVSVVPDGIAADVVQVAKRRRRRRARRTATVVVLVASGLTAILAMQSIHFEADNGEPASAGSPIPASLPGPEGLPPLSEAPMEAASVAYVVEGELVLVNAETGQAVRAFASPASLPPSLFESLRGGSASLRRAGADGWRFVVLSPDGARALIGVRTKQDADGLTLSLYVFDVESGEAVRTPERFTDPSRREVRNTQRVAWSPDSRSFACVCDREINPGLIAFDLSGTHDLVQQRWSILGEWAQASWGARGVAAEGGLSGRWVMISGDLGTGVRLPAHGYVALSESTDQYLEVSSKQNLASIGEPIVQRAEYRLASFDSESLETRRFSGSVASLGSLADGFYISVRVSGAFSVLTVDQQGEGFPLTRLPLTASDVSFASALVMP